MSKRYKGQTTARDNERAHPYWVDVPIPEGGLGLRLNEMHDWHRLNGMAIRHGSGGHGVARFCFPDQANAEGFAQAFGAQVRLDLGPV